MDTMISLREFLLLLLTIAGVAAFIFVAIAMGKVSGAAGSLKKILEDNRQGVRDAVKEIPAFFRETGEAVSATKKSIEVMMPHLQTTSENMEAVTADAKATLNTVKQVTGTIETGVKNVVNTVQDGMQDTADGVRLIAELIRLVVSMFS